MPTSDAHGHGAARPRTWLGVEFRHLLALEAVANQASFIRAAAALGYTQSAVSQQIATLERVVGQKLVERPGGTRPVRLTPAGEILSAHAREIGVRLATAEADLRAVVSGDRGPVRLGTFQGLGALVLPGILRRFAGLRRDTEVRLTESQSDAELLDLLAHGDVDLAFVHLPVPSARVESVRLLEDEYVLVVPETSTLATSGTRPTLEQLASLPLVGLGDRRSCRQVIEYFRAHGLAPKFVLRSDDSATIQGFVAADFGAALLPARAAEALLEGVRLVDLQGLLPARQIGLAWSLDRAESGAAETFVAAAIDECSRLPARLKAAS